MKPMSTTPIYRQSGNYARKHGELDQFLESRQANLACKEAIEGAISRSFEGMHLKHDAPVEVLDQYGIERVRFVLAATVQTKEWDGRFSEGNKRWAASCNLPDLSISNGENRLYEYAVNSHPAVVDGFIHLARKEIAEREKSSVKDALQQPMTGKAKGSIKKESVER